VLLLFDIDGTLTQNAAREHADALIAALDRVHGVGEPVGPFEAAGRTDLSIARSILLRHGVSADRIDAGADEVRAITCEEYAQRCPDDLSQFLAPGAAEVVEQFAADDRFQLSLVTGNLEFVARLKLMRAGIGHHFPDGQGGFGSDHEDRAALPPIARARAGHHPRERTVVIGDTPRDIACARADGLSVIAVTTGPFERAALTAADAVIDGLDELPDALLRLA
jgi:phosphoglycolate phosphatase-like HAD superfamily hydrolase